MTARCVYQFHHARPAGRDGRARSIGPASASGCWSGMWKTWGCSLDGMQNFLQWLLKLAIALFAAYRAAKQALVLLREGPQPGWA